MTEARLGYGTLLQRYTDSALVTVAEQVTINGPSLTSDDVEVTNHDSPGGSKEYIPALMDTGEVSFDGNFLPGDASHTQILADQKNRIVASWRIVLPDATLITNRTMWSFEGYIKSIDFSYPTQEAMTISATMKLAGAATLSSTHAANLTALAISEGTLTPAFAGGVYSYAATVADTVEDMTVTATCAAADAIRINGEAATSGAAKSVDLAVGVNYITIEVHEDDKTPRHTTIAVARASA